MYDVPRSPAPVTALLLLLALTPNLASDHTLLPINCHREDPIASFDAPFDSTTRSFTHSLLIALRMATLLLRRPLTLGLGLTSAFTFHSLLQSQSRRPLLCETSTGVRSDSFNTYERDAKVPVIKNGKVNTAAYKQISSGSILGMSHFGEGKMLDQAINHYRKCSKSR